MVKELKFNQDARMALFNGAKQVVDAVKVTLGPAGRNVALNDVSTGELVISKDGVTVAKAIELENKFENMGASLIKEVSAKSNDEVGDGTTTSTVLAGAILEEGIKAVASGSNSIYIKRGMDKATQLIVDEIKNISKKVSSTEDIKNIATISANNDEEMGSLVAEAIEKVGQDGVITVEESKNLNTTVKVTEGMELHDCGYISAYFSLDNAKEINFSDAYILLYDKTISSMKDILPILEKVAQTGKPLVIVCENMDGEALTTLVINNMRGTIKVCAIKAPGFGDYRKAQLEDLAIMTGGTLITEDVGLKLDKTTLDMLGKAKSVKITKDSTTFVEGAGDPEKIKERINFIKDSLNNVDGNSALSTIDADRLKDRHARLIGKVAVIEIGAVTETEMREKRYRIDDTLAATRAAIEEGIVAGGGTTLISIADKVLTEDLINNIKDSDEKLGYRIIKKAVEKPLWQIAENAGVSGDVVVSTVHTSNNFGKSNNFGYNARTNEYPDMFEAGVIDPAKVTRISIQNATSVAGMMITCEAVIADKAEKNVTPNVGGCPSQGMMM